MSTFDEDVAVPAEPAWMQDTTVTPEPAQSPSTPPELSILGQLHKRRDELAEEQILDLRVPRWTNPEVWVRYRLVNHEMLRSAAKYVEKVKGPARASAELNANCDTLLKACHSIVGVIDGKRYSLRTGDPHGDPTIFDADLARNLGLPEDTAGRLILKELFYSEGDIFAHANRLIEWSGYTTGEIDDELLDEVSSGG